MKTKTPATLTGADYYRETARSLRDRASTMKSAESRDELHALAAEYERLAEFAHPTSRAKPPARSK
jgi:hypothetical protein